MAEENVVFDPRAKGCSRRPGRKKLFSISSSRLGEIPVNFGPSYVFMDLDLSSF